MSGQGRFESAKLLGSRSGRCMRGKCVLEDVGFDTDDATLGRSDNVAANSSPNAISQRYPKGR
jgi:hypothetical protein